MDKYFGEGTVTSRGKKKKVGESVDSTGKLAWVGSVVLYVDDKQSKDP